MATVLEVQDLRTHLPTRRGVVKAVDGVSFSIQAGEIVGVVGESGCGKSTLCSTLVRLLPPQAQLSGKVLFKGKDLLTLDRDAMRAIRGRDITMVLQNPMTALDPVFTVGSQLREVLRWNSGMSGAERVRRALEMLKSVRIPSPEERLENYPHQMSGGMKQRVLTAMATALKPALLLADEPTTALDVTIQEQILGLFADIRDQLGTSIVLITHDLGVVRRLCDRVLIMYAGRFVESGTTEAIFTAPQHPYTQALLASIPKMGEEVNRLRAIEGQIPDLSNLPPGCAFAPRCPHRMPRCAEYPPVFGAGDTTVRCWLYEKAPEHRGAA